jgi:starvation-inducible DNA-binding protein
MAKTTTDKTTPCYCHLTQCLRDSIHVYHQSQLVHWNLMGNKFYQLHLLTERIYQEMEDGNDAIAEHIRSLDIATPKTVEDLIYSTMPEVPLDSCFNQEGIILQLATNHNLLAKKFEELAKMSEQIGDQLTLDLGVERGRVHKKNQWLLKANLSVKG